jgi:hypothetical protein
MWIVSRVYTIVCHVYRTVCHQEGSRKFPRNVYKQACVQREREREKGSEREQARNKECVGISQVSSLKMWCIISYTLATH